MIISSSFNFCRNRLTLFEHNLINSTNVSDIVYEQALNATFLQNKTDAMAWGLSQECSLAHQLSQAAEGTGLAFIVFTQVSLDIFHFFLNLFHWMSMKFRTREFKQIASSVR